MKSNVVAFVGLSALIIVVLVIGLVIARPVLAQVDATSSETGSEAAPAESAESSDAAGTETPAAEPSEESTPAGSSGTVLGAATDTETQTAATETPAAESEATEVAPPQQSDVAPAAESAATEPPPQQMSASQPPPEGLTEVHIIGSKYTDYFTDGTTITSYPGDPTIDGNLDKPNAPVPSHEGLTWLRTTGDDLYDTQSGDLEVGQYAVLSNGSYISNPLPSSTSTPQQ